ncbi:ankyrin repeat protein SKIP35 isoform X4 [Physcomitrium patens]|uniref:ankyrin repeat protein SKIP35 isoform X4 n=1 Tax=Physcomitrium patens TaxID=3218 RepID=UPI003CCD12FD
MYTMEEVEATPMEEDEILGVRHSFECDVGICGGWQNVNHIHSQECRASTSELDRVDSPSGSNDEVSSRTAECFEGTDGCVAEASGRDTPAKLHCSRTVAGEDDGMSLKKDHIELGRSFQLAVSVHDWALAESLVPLADPQRLNDGLCIALDSIWFLSTSQELAGATCLIERLILAGAHDFSRAALRTSFLASCVSACRSRTMSLADTVTVMAQRLRERLQECNGDEILKAEAAAKVQRFTEWALKCIGSHSRGKGAHPGSPSDICMAIIHSSAVESRLQLMAFKRFLELAASRLTKKDYTEAFDAACFPLTLFSSAIDPGWATGIAASAMQGLLGLLVEGGADNVNQCFLEAARFGSTELVRILLQIAQRNGVELDVDLALGFASHYSKIGTMECLVEDGKADSFLGPLMRAAERGCIEVVHWFVEKGCKDMELCLALTAAASSSRVEVAAFLLSHVPHHVLQTLSAEILKAAGERSGGSLKGIAFLLQADFLNNPEATYTIADSIAKSEDEAITTELRAFLLDEWSEEAFFKGRLLGEAHHLNVMRALKRGSSPLHLQELPLQLQVTVAYLPLYKECVAASGVILSQLLRGQLVEAAVRLNQGGLFFTEEMLLKFSKHELLSVLESRLPGFLLASEGNAMAQEAPANKVHHSLGDDDGGHCLCVRYQLDQSLFLCYRCLLLGD